MYYRILVFLHLTAACCWVGGLLFFALVLVPVIRRAADPKTAELVRAVGLRFRQVGWAAISVLLVTGPGCLLYRAPLAALTDVRFWFSDFGKLLLLKLSLVAVMLAVTIAHDLLGMRATLATRAGHDAASARSLRVLASRLGRAGAALSLAIVFVAVLLVRGSW